MMKFVDSHCHLYLEEFDADRAETLARSKDAGVEKLILPNVDTYSLTALLNCLKLDSQALFSAMGIHPCSIKENFKSELLKIEAAVSLYQPIAIGEIGMDLYWDKTFFEEQKQAFETQISWAISLNIPVIIHNRDAFEETFKIVRKYPKLRGVFHAFSGNVEQAKQVVDAGFYLGIGGVVTFKNGGVDKILKDVPLQNIVLETDAPYLTPVPFRGKRNEPAYIPLISEKMASIYERSILDIADITWKNSHDLFSI